MTPSDGPPLKRSSANHRRPYERPCTGGACDQDRQQATERAEPLFAWWGAASKRTGPIDGHTKHCVLPFPVRPDVPCVAGARAAYCDDSASGMFGIPANWSLATPGIGTDRLRFRQALLSLNSLQRAISIRGVRCSCGAERCLYIAHRAPPTGSGPGGGGHDAISFEHAGSFQNDRARESFN